MFHSVSIDTALYALDTSSDHQ